MTSCDLCEKSIEPGEPRFGGQGDGGRQGAIAGKGRHWSCHVARFGKPGDGTSNFDNAPREARRTRVQRLLRPKVLRGPDNRSANARREWQALRAISEMGRRRIEIECPFCFLRFWAYVWSLAGGGKRCPNCRAMFTSFGVAWPLEGNEDLTE